MGQEQLELILAQINKRRRKKKDQGRSKGRKIKMIHLLMMKMSTASIVCMVMAHDLDHIKPKVVTIAIRRDKRNRVITLSESTTDRIDMEMKVVVSLISWLHLTMTIMMLRKNIKPLMRKNTSRKSWMGLHRVKTSITKTSCTRVRTDIARIVQTETHRIVIMTAFLLTGAQKSTNDGDDS